MWMPGFILDNLSITFCFLILIAAYMFNADRSDKMALIVWVALGVCMSLVSSVILDIAKESNGNGYLWWYGSWASFDLFGMVALYYLHLRSKIKPSKFTLFVSVSFLILALLQAIGYMDRAVLKLRVADDFYRYMILAVNICIVPMALLAIWPAVKKSVSSKCSVN